MWALSWLKKGTKWNIEVLAFLTNNGVLVLPALDFKAVRNGETGHGLKILTGQNYSNDYNDASPSLFSVNINWINRTISYQSEGLNLTFKTLGSIHSHPPDGEAGWSTGVDLQNLGGLGTVFMMDATDNNLWRATYNRGQGPLCPLSVVFKGGISLYDNL